MNYIVFGSMLMALTAVAVFIPRFPAVLAGYATMLLCNFGGVAYFSGETLIFWGVATLIVLGITYLLPRQVSASRVGVPFIAGGALVGVVVGMMANSMAGIIVGGLAGALFGGIAFANTATARQLMSFPSKKFFNYLAAKGLPAVVALAMAAACLIQLVNPAAPV